MLANLGAAPTKSPVHPPVHPPIFIPSCGAPTNEGRIRKVISIPETKINWVEIKKKDPEVFVVIEEAISVYLRERKYPASAAKIAEFLKETGFEWPVRLNGRRTDQVIKTIVGRGFLDNISFQLTPNGVVSGFIYFGNNKCFHEKWVEAARLIDEGKKVILK